MATIADNLKAKQEAHLLTQISSRILSFLKPLPLLDINTSNRTYPGNGTTQNPYIISYLPNDHQDAMNLSKARKWTIAMSQAMTFFALTFGSSIYASGVEQIEQHFRVSNEIAILGLALYVLGFALGPILWAPMSEVYGRRLTFMISYTIYMAFTIATPAATNISALLVLRSLAGAFGASAQTNPGGMIADLFTEEERGPVMAVFAACPFLGPALGPVVGGFIAETKGWRWALWMNAMLNGVVWIVALLVTSETCAPVILRARARALFRKTGEVYVSRLDAGKPPKTLSKELKISLARPLNRQAANKQAASKPATTPDTVLREPHTEKPNRLTQADDDEKSHYGRKSVKAWLSEQIHCTPWAKLQGKIVSKAPRKNRVPTLDYNTPQ